MYAGTPGVKMVVRGAAGEAWKVMEGEPRPGSPLSIVNDVAMNGGEDRAVTSAESASAGSKRPRSQSPTDGPNVKHARVSLCLAPPVNATAQEILSKHENDRVPGAGDVFLTDGWRDRWCRCSSVRVSLMSFVYIGSC
jgi:E3 ubiquitin-protein ligase UBR7